MTDGFTAGRGARQQLLDLVGTQLTLHSLYGDEPPLVGKRWAIEAILGSGGFGVVFRARDLQLQRAVALKLYALDGDEGELRAAVREGRSLARLDHPAIVVVHGVDEDDLIVGEQRLRCAVVEMKLVDGETLPQWLRSAPREPALAAGVLLGAGRALAYAHAQGLVHRDFKPDNVMVDRGGQPKVIDFGLALVAQPSRASGSLPWSSRSDAIGTRDTATGVLRGTPGYMAPELSEQQPSPASDQFAFAVVMSEVLYGSFPLAGGRSPASGLPLAALALSSKLRPLLTRAMADAPGDRFPSMETLCDAIARELRRAPSPAKAPALARRGWALVGLAGVGLAAMAATAAWGPRCAGNDLPEDEVGDVSSRAATPGEGCPALARFVGDWYTTARIQWSESGSDARAHHFLLRLGIGLECSLSVEAKRLVDLHDDPSSRATLSTTTRASVSVGADGTSVASIRLTFPDDVRRYGVQEHDELLLELPNGYWSQLSGAYRRTDNTGLRLRSGPALAVLDAAPSAELLAALRTPCSAQCWIECAGAHAEAACRSRGCGHYGDDPRDRCGPSDPDFASPLGATIVLDRLLSHKSLLSDDAKQREICKTHAARLIGAWGVWRGTGRDAELFSLELTADGCNLGGQLTAPDGGPALAVVGEAAADGAWTLRAATPDPRLRNAWALVGVGPAFGLDTGTPATKLRAYVRGP